MPYNKLSIVLKSHSGKGRVMSELWHLDYIQLALSIDKIFRDRIEFPCVDFYYGPLDWKTQIENEPE
jgi:hypothetical protein